MKTEDLNYTRERLIEMKTWAHFSGFTADTCGKCKKTANVLAGPGWFCICGHYNLLPFSNQQKPHEKPDLGPGREFIREALS